LGCRVDDGVFLAVSGRFLAELLSTISRWHGSAELYSKEAKGDGLPGFQKKWTASVAQRKLSDEELLSYEDFRRVVFKWHVNLLKVSLRLGDVRLLRRGCAVETAM
jgi:hypothetical protein